MTGEPQQTGISCFAKTGRGKEEEFLLCSLLKENLECMAMNYDNSSPTECLWVKVRGIGSKGNLTVCICLGLPNQDNKINKIIFGSLKQSLGQHSLVLRGDLTHPDIFLEEQGSSSHIIRQVSGMHTGLLPHTNVRSANQK